MSSLPSLGALPSLPCTLVLMLLAPTSIPSPESVSSNTANGRLPWLPCLNPGRLPPGGAPPPIVTRSAELRALSPLGRLLDDLPAPDVSTRPKTACATGRRRGRQAHITAHSPSTTVNIQGTAMSTLRSVSCKLYVRSGMVTSRLTGQVSVFATGAQLEQEDQTNGANERDAETQVSTKRDKARIGAILTICPVGKYQPGLTSAIYPCADAISHTQAAP